MELLSSPFVYIYPTTSLLNFVVNVQLGCVVVVTLTKLLKSHPAYQNLFVLSQVKARAESDALFKVLTPEVCQTLTLTTR